MALILRFLLLLVIVIFASCEVNRTNNNEDKEEASKIGEMFYANVLADERIALSQKFGQDTPPDLAMETFETLDSIAGQLKSYEINEIRTDVTIKDGKKAGRYEIYAKCNYEKVLTDEKIQIVVNDTGYVIVGYNATIDVK